MSVENEMFPEYATLLNEIEHLITTGKYLEALNKIQGISSKENLKISDQIKFNITKIIIFNELGQYQEALKLTDELLNKSQLLENSLQMLDIISSKAKALAHLGEIGKSLAYIKLGEKILDKSNNENPSELLPRKAALYYEKGFIFEVDDDLKNALDTYLNSLSIYRDINDKIGLAKINTKIAKIYFKMGDVVRALLIYQQSLSLNKEIKNDLVVTEVLDNIGMIYLWKGEYGPALEYCLQGLALSEEIQNKKAIGCSLNCISGIYNHLGELNRSIELLERSLALFEEINDQKNIARTLNVLSVALVFKGELNQAIEYLTQAQEIYTQNKDKLGLAGILETLGIVLYEQGDYDQAIDSLKRCIDLRKDQMNKKELINALFWLILVQIECNEFNEAQENLIVMQKSQNQQKNLLNDFMFRLISAIIVAQTSNVEHITKAKTILHDIINEEPVDLYLKGVAIYHLCETLLKEIDFYNDTEKLVQLNNLITTHYNIAKQLESQNLIAENFWLKANVSIIQKKPNEARLFLDEAQHITEEKGLQRLGMKITNAQEIIETTKEPITLQKYDSKISTDLDKLKINNNIMKIIDKRTIEIPKFQEEEPVLLIIIFEGGITVFSKKFSYKEMIDEMFVGGFLTAIDAFMHQTFATGGSIERIQHQEYTLLLKAESPLLFCYVFKGQSFTAIQKLDQMVNDLKKLTTLWSTLTEKSGEQLSSLEKENIEKLADNIFLKDKKLPLK